MTTTDQMLLEELRADITGTFTQSYFLVDVMITIMLSLIQELRKQGSSAKGIEQLLKDPRLKWVGTLDAMGVYEVWENLSLKYFIGAALAGGLIPQIHFIPLEEEKQRVIEALERDKHV